MESALENSGRRIIENHAFARLLLLTYLVTYLLLTYNILPRFMKNRPPFSLARFMLIYNVVQIITNTYVVCSVLSSGWASNPFLYCGPSRFVNEQERTNILRPSWVYFTLKLVDLVETPMYVLRKKDRQITFLHVYHHIFTLTLTYYSLEHGVDDVGNSLLPVMLNSFIHIIMYTYYLLASLGPLARSIAGAMKKKMTTIQIVQLLAAMIYLSPILRSDCKAPRLFLVSLFVHYFINVVLFVDFYYKQYLEKAKSQ